MEAVFAITLGIMTASGVYLLLRARIFPVVMGLTLISYAVNLFIFSMGRLATGVPAVIGKVPSTVIRCLRHWSSRRSSSASP